MIISAKYVVFLIVYSVIAYTVHCLGKDYYTKRINQGKTHPKLYDVGMQLTPDLSSYTTAHLVFDIFTTALPILIGFNVALEHSQYMVVVIMIRMLCNTVTILPKMKSCDDSEFTWKNLWFGHCYDKIFSGHAATIAIVSLIVYSKQMLSLTTLVLFNIVYSWFIIAFRYHYSIDILIAYLVAMFVYSNKLKINMFE